jgi:hypothetical protein
MSPGVPLLRLGRAVRAKTSPAASAGRLRPGAAVTHLVCPPVVEGGLEVNAGSVVVVRCLRCQGPGRNDLTRFGLNPHSPSSSLRGYIVRRVSSLPRNAAAMISRACPSSRGCFGSFKQVAREAARRTAPSDAARRSQGARPVATQWQRYLARDDLIQCLT